MTERGMVVGPRRAGLSISNTDITDICLKKRKYPVSGSCVDENDLLMSEENERTG